MSPLKASLVWGLVAGVVTVGALFFLRQSGLREFHGMQSQNDRMRLEPYQNSVGRPAGSTVPVGSTPRVASTGPATARPPATSPAGKMAEYYRNEGNATPLATLQTFAWACDRGDTETVGRLLHIDAAARPKAEAFIAALPESARAQWKTVEEMAAAVLTRSIMASPFPNADILETATPEPVGADRVRLRLPDVPKDGTEYQKTAEGWKYVLTQEVVDAYIQQSRRP